MDTCVFRHQRPGVNNVFTREELEILERNENPAGPLGEKVHLFKIRLNDTFESLSGPANNFITLLALKVLGELTDDYRNFFDFVLSDNYKIPDNNEAIMKEIIKFGVEEYGKLGTTVKEELQQKFPIIVDVLNDATFREHYADALGLPTLAPATTTTTRASRLRF
ncbi:hypothetical protein AAVH_17730 [Aphelenchoides avenae]|nr:hypothetical protein AAVH_17730 [Aphelenchus avenae]